MAIFGNTMYLWSGEEEGVEGKREKQEERQGEERGGRGRGRGWKDTLLNILQL